MASLLGTPCFMSLTSFVLLPSKKLPSELGFTLISTYWWQGAKTVLWWNWGWGTWLGTWEQWSIPGQSRAHLDPVHPGGGWVSLVSSTATRQCHWLEELGFSHFRMQEVRTSLLQDDVGGGSQEKACPPGITRYKICGSKTNHRPYLLVDWGCCRQFGLGQGKSVRWLAVSFQGERVG